MSSKLYVGNLPWSVDQTGLEEIFKPHGNVQSAKLITDRDTGRSKGFGFVEMGSAEEAQAAISALDGSDQDGRNIRVNIAEDRRPPRR